MKIEEEYPRSGVVIVNYNGKNIPLFYFSTEDHLNPQENTQDGYTKVRVKGAIKFANFSYKSFDNYYKKAEEKAQRKLIENSLKLRPDLNLESIVDIEQAMSYKETSRLIKSKFTLTGKAIFSRKQTKIL